MGKMKAMQVITPGKPMELVEMDIPTFADNQVLIKVEACGVCSGDSAVIEGKAKKYPIIPGHEVVGKIAELGSHVNNWEIGQRVGIGYHAGNGHVNGRTVNGGFAQYIVANADQIVHIPEGISSIEASPLMCAGETTFSALKNSQAKAGDLVAIQGLGGLGHLAIQYAKKSGFETVAISRGKEKESLIKSLGATHYIDSLEEDIGSTLRNLGGATVVLNTAPTSESNDSLISGLKKYGQLIVVSGSNQPLNVSPSQLLTNYLSIKGSFTAGKDEIQKTLRFSELNDVKPLIETFPLEMANEAFQKMKEAKVKFRAVLKISD